MSVLKAIAKTNDVSQDIKKTDEYKNLMKERNRPTRVDVIKRELGNLLRWIKGEDLLPILTARKDLHSISKFDR